MTLLILKSILEVLKPIIIDNKFTPKYFPKMESLVVATGSGVAGLPIAPAPRLVMMDIDTNPAPATTQLLQVGERTARGHRVPLQAALTIRTAILVITHLIMTFHNL